MLHVDLFKFTISRTSAGTLCVKYVRVKTEYHAPVSCEFLAQVHSSSHHQFSSNQCSAFLDVVLYRIHHTNIDIEINNGRAVTQKYKQTYRLVSNGYRRANLLTSGQLDISDSIS